MWTQDKAKAYARAYKKQSDGIGFLGNLYSRMRERIMGQRPTKAHLYVGKELLTRSEFYAWATTSEEFHKLFKAYKESGYSIKLVPTIDRIDSSIGYILSNMEWVTHSENSRRGALSRWKKTTQCES